VVAFVRCGGFASRRTVFPGRHPAVAETWRAPQCAWKPAAEREKIIAQGVPTVYRGGP